MQPDRRSRPEYVEAVCKIVSRIEHSLENVPPHLLPIRMYIAGGTALHLYTGVRVSKDIDAVFSRRIALPEDLEVGYRDADGKMRLIYFDRQYNDTFALMHGDNHDDSVPLSLPGIEPQVLEVRLLSPLDLAVSKVSRFAEHDREDIALLAREGLIKSKDFRRRAEEAMSGYVGDLTRLRGSIELAVRIVEDAERASISRGRIEPPAI